MQKGGSNSDIGVTTMNWDEVAARIELCLVVGEDGRPTEADLDAYEAAAGFKLPLDYPVDSPWPTAAA